MKKVNNKLGTDIINRFDDMIYDIVTRYECYDRVQIDLREEINIIVYTEITWVLERICHEKNINSL